MINKKYSFNQIEAHLDQQGFLHFEDDNETKKLFTSTNLVYDVLFCSYVYDFTTLDDDEDVQCCGYCMRSVGDIYRICKYYQPNTTVEFVYKELCRLIEEALIGSWICGEIKKRVYFAEEDTYTFNGVAVDEYSTEFPEFSHLSNNEDYGWNYTKKSLNFIKI